MQYTASSSRYDGKAYNRAGDSGLLLSPVSLGLWQNFSCYDNFETMRQTCFTAFDNGVIHFDLANNYGPEPGDAEINFSRILKSGLSAYRDEIVISTKAGYLMWDGPYGNFGSRKHLLASLDQSLKRLGVDYVDIFYHHRMDPETALEESMGALASAVKSGKALYAGLSNYDGETMKKACKILRSLNCPFVINQNRYSILDRTIEKNGLRDASLEENKGLLVFSALAQGLLTDRYLYDIPPDSRAAKNKSFLKYHPITQKMREKLLLLNELAAQRGQTLAQTALAWVMRDPAVTGILVGASSPRQLLDNLSMIHNTYFTKEELSKIDDITADIRQA